MITPKIGSSGTSIIGVRFISSIKAASLVHSAKGAMIMRILFCAGGQTASRWNYFINSGFTALYPKRQGDTEVDLIYYDGA